MHGNLKLELDGKCLLNMEKKPVIIPANGVTKNETVCDKPIVDKDRNQENVAIKMIRMGGLELPGLVPNSPSRSQTQTPTHGVFAPTLNKTRQNSMRSSMRLNQEDGAHARVVTPPAVLAGQQPQSVIRTGSFICSDIGSQMSNAKSFPDAVSIRSLASIGMGSTDGKRMIDHQEGTHFTCRAIQHSQPAHVSHPYTSAVNIISCAAKYTLPSLITTHAFSTL